VPDELTQQKLAAAAWQQLAIIGGAVTRDDTMTFSGTAWNIPAVYKGNVIEGVRDLMRYAESMEEIIISQRTFRYRPYDGAYAVHRVLKDRFGYVQSKGSRSNPPQEVSISIGWTAGPPDEKGRPTRIEQKVNVPFGSNMVLPGLEGGVLSVGATKDGKMCHLVAQHKRKYEDGVVGFFDDIQKFLDEHSIYRGKAFDGKGGFIDTDLIEPEKFVFTEQVWEEAEAFIFSVMRDRDLLSEEDIAGKRAVLLAGEFGGGKTGMGKIAALVAVRNGWSALMSAPGDSPFEMIQLAQMYAPCLIFGEDIETVVDLRNDRAVSQLLDTIDGADAKDHEVLAVYTTNYLDKIPAGMFRPGRFHRVIEIGAMDRPGVEKLTRLICGEGLADDVDFDVVYAATEGYMPAFVREGIEGAVRFSIAKHRRRVATGDITTERLVFSLNSLRTQHRMLLAAMEHKPELPPLDQSMREIVGEMVQDISVEADIDYDIISGAVNDVVENRMNGARLIHIESGDERFEINTN